MIKGIAFDLQFTLVFLEDFTLLKWFQLFDKGFFKVMDYLRENNFSFDPKKLFRTLKRVRNKYFARTITEDQQYFTEEILNDTFLKNNIQFSPETLIKCCEVYHSVEIPAWKPNTNIKQILGDLSKKYKLAIITNASRYVTNEILKLQDIQDLFHLFFSHARKPRLDFFIKFKEMMNCEYKELAMVGDDVKTDIEPALKIGMRAIHLFRGYEYLKHHSSVNIKPDRKINNLEDLLFIVEEF
ncbi:MAG: HAD family hydrolase [Candidatus Helarchaeota archaeon]|nr:HAD family hydrolase [Candidatus Helarchaeota archaeon]